MKEKIIKWAEQRDLFENGSVTAQSLKLIEEFGELAKGILENDRELIKDSIGDVKVVLIILKQMLENLNGKQSNVQSPVFKIMKSICDIIDNARFINFANERLNRGQYFRLDLELDELAKAYGFTLDEALEHAYNEIKDRKGETINGTFIRER